MAFHYRKLLNDDDHKMPKKCKSFLDDPPEPCPPDCVEFCFTAAKNPELEIPSSFLPPPRKMDSPSKVPLFFTVFLIILTATAFFFACYFFFKFCFTRYLPWRTQMDARQPTEEEPVRDEFVDADQEPMVDHPIWYIRTVGLQPSVISAITVFKYKKDDGLIECTDCSVCLSGFREDESLRLLPKCNHAFHTTCIDTWLRSHTNCPICRAAIVKNTPVSSLSTQEPTVSMEEISPVSYGNREVERESETESSPQIRIRIEEDDESRDQIGLKGEN